ncbi:MAG: glycogen/starch/alpha-glucan phosphorylase [Sphaerochaetaceae bacterium]|nr:glycogen/starch/alpha-glucan phosphorylase [Sphaerochaetaceae bacterium]
MKTINEIKEKFEYHLKYTLASDKERRTDEYNLEALSFTLKEPIIDAWNATIQKYRKNKVKRVCYLSLEFLMGRLLTNNLLNLGMYDKVKKSLEQSGVDLDNVIQTEKDAGLGNGGLGRLAACFLDSLSTLGYPAIGYGIRYNYGIFRQEIENGYQKEQPDDWLIHSSALWEIPRDEIKYPVSFGGSVQSTMINGKMKFIWNPQETVYGMAYDMPIVGYEGKTVNTLRLWSAKARDEFDFSEFNDGDYTEAVRKKIAAENISQVLYPNDTLYMGKVLRLKQQYFFVSCSLQDIIARYKKDIGSNLKNLAEYNAIQLNDTHPSIAVAELMRLLIDNEGLSWDEAWEITSSVFSYTNHTLLPEALEKWNLDLFSSVLPRHTEIIYEINRRFLEKAVPQLNGDVEAIRKVSIIEESNPKNIRMANLAIIGSQKVNGVAALHSELLKTKMFPEFSKIYPYKFTNITNGVTQRRWLLESFPEYAALITKAIGDKWITNYNEILKIEKYQRDKNFIADLKKAKQSAKERFASYAKQKWGFDIDTSRLFDTQCKRIHEYKRQSLNILDCIALYARIKEDKKFRDSFTPVNIFFAGKAAPGYVRAKETIKLINEVALTLAHDNQTRDYIRVYFLPNYDVSMAEMLIPASDLSEQISTAGMEASGTGNMKFMINAALTLGTMDGANVEIADAVGQDNIFIFGKNVKEIEALKGNYNPYDYISKSVISPMILSLIKDNYFSVNENGIFDWVIGSTANENTDRYALWADIDSYDQKRLEAYALYKNDNNAWMKKAVINTASSVYFSSDRTINEYAHKIWNMKSVQ